MCGWDKMLFPSIILMATISRYASIHANSCICSCLCNTVSAQGETLVSLHYELPVTLLLEHIPLAATDYFVGRCRREYTTTVETLCGIVRLIFIFLRLIW